MLKEKFYSEFIAKFYFLKYYFTTDLNVWRRICVIKARQSMNMEEETINSSLLGTKGLVTKMVKWVKRKLPDCVKCKIIDLGCVNGHLLYSLYQEGYTDLTGLDYADKSIKLVDQMAKDLCIDGFMTLAPQFSFSGRNGNNVTCLIFQRLSK
uniref:Methyltransferase domain-containing protein n=1 Tax=Tetranychus urticae TaxID=32264 RepID=T1KV87_TETUR